MYVVVRIDSRDENQAVLRRDCFDGSVQSDIGIFVASWIFRDISSPGEHAPLIHCDTACLVTPSFLAKSLAVIPSSVCGRRSSPSRAAAFDIATMANTYSCSCTQSRSSFAQGIVHADMPARISTDERRKSIIAAANKWIEKHGGQSPGAVAAKEKGVELSQQSLSWASKGQKLGPLMADRIAALYETTPDGLVYMFIRGGNWRLLRDVPGWAKAKSEARTDARSHDYDPWVWDAIDNVTVPAQVRLAMPQMVLDIARFLHEWGKVSSVRPKLAAAR